MTWKLTGTPKTQRITKKLAEQYMNTEPAPDDRPMSELRLRVYEKLARAGDFRPMTWATAYCKETGGTYRVNGKHTSTLFAGLEPLPELYAVCEVYECETLADVARLYSTFDSKMQSRTVADINRSFASCVPQLVDVDMRTINTCTPAIWYARLQENYSKMQPQERAEALLEHHNFVVWVNKMLGRSNVKQGHLKRMPVIAAMFSTFQKHPNLAENFWIQVRDETGDKPSDPDRKLSRFLLTSGLLRRDRLKRMIVPQREFFVKCLLAWNSWRTKEPTNLAYHAKAQVPDVK